MSARDAVYSPEWNGDLAAFAALLKSPDRAERTREFLSASVDHLGMRRMLEGKLGVWLQYFRHCQERHGGAFLTDPLQLDRFVIELTDAAARIAPRSWPQLERLRDEAYALARETFPFRRGVWTAAATPLPPAQA